jgi:legumain
MRSIILVLLFAIFFYIYAGQNDGVTWAVLVAGSNTYGNFRHQSDVCQAYQQLHKAGIPDERIIVWMYDDIAFNKQNPHQGSIINYYGGPNVYPGVPHDYIKGDVVPKNFLKLLRGEDMKGIGSGKSLKSGPNDRIFVFYTDHGGPGIICFPGFIELHVADLIDTLKYMFEHKMYKQMIWYLEACESGSMFNKVLPDNWNIYAVTASNPTTSSWACDWDSNYQAYLNDCWSRNFLNDTRWAMDHGMLNKRTYEEQFEWVKIQTTQSPECKYGDFSIQKKTLDQFQGEPGHAVEQIPMGHRSGARGVPTHDVKLSTLEKRTLLATGSKKVEMQKELDEWKAHIARIDLIWKSFASALGLKPSVNADTCYPKEAVQPQCMKEMVTVAKENCGNFDEYSSKYYSYLHQACIQGKSVQEVKSTLSEICGLLA